MKVSTFNKYQCFVIELMQGIILEMSEVSPKHIFSPSRNDKLTDLADELVVLRQLCKKLELYKPDPDEENEAHAFIDFITDDLINLIPPLASSDKQDDIKSVIRAYSRIYLSLALTDDYNASALISELYSCKNRTLQSKWLSTDKKHKPSIETFKSEIESIIQKLSLQVD